MSRRTRLATRPTLERLDARLVLSAVTPAQLQATYGLSGVTSSGTTLTGAGQTIAIVDAYNDPNAATELATFDAKYGLSAASLTVDNLGTASNVNSGWEQEEALDIEAAHLAAPGAKIILIEAKSDSLTDLMAGVAAANATTGVTVVSMSWGGSDSTSETQYDSYFTHAGITYLAASGDNGAGAEWPSDSPNVVAVGGTTLTISGSTTSQSAWVDSGGGTSRVEAEPTYQDVAQTTGYRTTPDVSLDADPNTGLIIYSVAGGGYEQIGGTSLSTPIWAGLIAEADQGRVLAGKATLSSVQALEDLYEAPSGSFSDITTGSRATTSYDTSTGLGTPNGATLIAALIADPSTTGSTTGNGVGGDPLPTTTGTGTGGGSTNPNPPGRPPGGGRRFFQTPGSYSSTNGWAGAYTPRNSGQGSAAAFVPITPTRIDRTSAETTVTTTPRVTRATPQLPPATGVTNPQFADRGGEDHQAFDAALESLFRGRS